MDLAARAAGRGAGAVIEAMWLSAVLVVLLHYEPRTRGVYESPKLALLASLVVLGVLAAVVERVSAGRASVSSLVAGVRAWLGVPLHAAAAATTATMALSTLLSLRPAMSWLGSNERRSGLLLQLLLLALFALVASRLRGRAQWRRLGDAAILGGAIAGAYALLQRMALDPAFPAGLPRPGAGQGNSILLGAALSFTLMWTLVRVARSRRRDLRSVALFGAAALQAAGLVVAAARGPTLGAAAALTAACFALAAMPPQPDLPLPRRVARAAGIAIMVFVVAAGVLPAASSQRPGLPRLAGWTDAEQQSAGVRIEAWRAAAAVFFSAAPLVDADGTPDRFNALRFQLGFGPDQADAALGPFASAELEQRHPGRRIDRAHNEVWQRLLTGGLLGLVAWAWLIHAALSAAFRLLGASSVGDRLPGALGLGGAVAGALLGTSIAGTLALGAGAGLGYAAGMLACLAWRSWHPLAGTTGTRGWRREAALVGVAGILGGVVELQFGVGSLATQALLWILCGCLAAASLPVRRPASRPVGPFLLPAVSVLLVLGATTDVAHPSADGAFATIASTLAGGAAPGTLPIGVLLALLAAAVGVGGGKVVRAATARHGVVYLAGIVVGILALYAAAGTAATSGDGVRMTLLLGWAYVLVHVAVAVIVATAARRVSPAWTAGVALVATALAVFSPWSRDIRHEIAFAAGANQLKAGGLATALPLLESAFRSAPLRPEYAAALGTAFGMQATAGGREGAEPLFEAGASLVAQAGRSDPWDSFPRVALGDHYVRWALAQVDTGRRRTLLESAVIAYRQALSRRPADAAIAERLAAVNRLRQGDGFAPDPLRPWLPVWQ